MDLDPFSAGFLRDPWPGLAELREAGPVVWLDRYRIWAMALRRGARGAAGLGDHHAAG
jgi:hypothetical protein